jgi:hypothetical protein
MTFLIVAVCGAVVGMGLAMWCVWRWGRKMDRAIANRDREEVARLLAHRPWWYLRRDWPPLD